MGVAEDVIKYTNGIFVNGELQAVDNFATELEPNKVRVSNFNMRIGGPFVEPYRNRPYLLRNVRPPYPPKVGGYPLSVPSAKIGGSQSRGAAPS